MRTEESLAHCVIYYRVRPPGHLVRTKTFLLDRIHSPSSQSMRNSATSTIPRCLEP
jgi:hypothetical protein